MSLMNIRQIADTVLLGALRNCSVGSNSVKSLLENGAGVKNADENGACGLIVAAMYDYTS